MRILLKNNPAKFDPDPIWNDVALAFFEQRYPNKKHKKNKNNNSMSSDGISSWSRNA